MKTSYEMKSMVAFLGLLAWLGAGCTQNLPTHKFTIVYTNDVRGEFEPCG